MKKQGSSKIDASCTASIKVEYQEKCIQVEVCNTHYGHNQDIGHLRIPAPERINIAAQLAQGVTFEKILDCVRDSVESKVQRIHLMNRKDLHNIQQAYNIQGIERHSNDALSVHAWVEEMKSKEHNPISFYKQQGSVVADIGKNTCLHTQDFALCIQTTLQCEMMEALL